MKHLGTLTSKQATVALSSLLLMLFLCQSCVEDLTGQWPVIQEEMVGDYLENHPELFSEFTGMLTASGAMGMLKAYGTYTVFAPTNEAMERYYQYVSNDKGETITSYDQLPLYDVREFCFNHIIKGDSLKVKYMHAGLLSQRTMSGRLYSISSSDSAIVINDYCPILARDIELHNGVIQVLGEAFKPAYGAIAEVFEKDSTRFSIYVKALKATEVYDKINKAKIQDETYDYKMGEQPGFDPDNYYIEKKVESLLFGFTILAVSDDDLANYVDVAAGLPNGIHSMADLEKLARYHYGIAFNHDADAITDKTDKRHYLNRFMSYQCFDRILFSSRFVKDYITPNHLPQNPMPEYIETMLDNTIVEVLLDKQGSIIGSALAADSSSAYGVFNYDDPAQRALLTQLKNLPAGGAANGYYHGITRPIMYTKPLSDALSSKRLRMDMASFFPELATNNLRGRNPTGDGVFVNRHRIISWVIDNKQVKNLETSSSTHCLYIEPNARQADIARYQGDWFIVAGLVDITLTTCPIPAGTYEVRLGNIFTGDDNLYQLYFDNLSCGAPTNYDLIALGLNRLDDPRIMNVYEFDKMLRNYRFIRGPNSLYTWNGESTDHHWAYYRLILGTFTFKKTEKHSLRIKQLGGEEGYNILDYIEFCPVSYLQKEGID